MRIAVAVVAALAALPAWADQVSWTHPTAYTDNTPLALADIASTRIEWSNTNPFGTVAGSQVVTGTANTATVPDPPAGSVRCYRALTTVVATKGGGTSVPSVTFCKTEPFPDPNPPTNITVTSTRIGASEWECRDAAGAVLSAHVRQDKAQESCTNLALASLGTPFEIWPSGYRIVARTAF